MSLQRCSVCALGDLEALGNRKPGPEDSRTGLGVAYAQAGCSHDFHTIVVWPVSAFQTIEPRWKSLRLPPGTSYSLLTG